MVGRASIIATFAAIVFLVAGRGARGEDGSKLWLRYANGGDEHARRIVVQGRSATCEIVRAELAAARLNGDEAIVVGTPGNSALIAALRWESDLNVLGPDGFLIRSAELDGRPAIVVASSTEIGALYGTFHLLRLAQTGQLKQPLAISQKPKLKLRLLNHWDNLDGSIERGYAGRSIWKWNELPGTLDPRYTVYARANASIGINGVVLNNVNASPKSLSREYLIKTAALADLWRAYGIRVYLTANFASPKKLGNLPTADPLDPQVIAWWKAKAEEIYQLIPDFGGFLVKANSEGQPGPQDFHRTHADGANTLADALASRGGGGIVMWRAFVYDSKDPDRAKRAYEELTPLDGRFRANVIVQAKNGPIDFQPREPFHPLFGAMRRTRLAAELQITQENLGQQTHLVYLAPMWKECLDADTFASGAGSTVSKQISAIAGVANIGADTNWCGHHFAQANWYAFGRLAWDPDLSAEQIADEWLAQTFTTDAATRATLRTMMMSSWPAFVSYSEPLGLHHWVAGDHYAPSPWHDKDVRPEFTATYYHRADSEGIGFDRTSRGSAAVNQYNSPLREQLDDENTCPESFLLWFHHVPWSHRMKSGRTLWEELCFSYDSGADAAKTMETTWNSLKDKINDEQRHREVAQRLAIQSRDAAAWRDKCLQYFQSVNHLPMPSGQRKGVP
jgi:alpha-glucuronidase